MLIDDERLALKQLKRMLEEVVGGVEIIEMTSNPVQALERSEELQPDVVFLDIHMPGMNGLKLGEKLQQAVPHVEIVFVTAYDQYAVKAFDICALDYILKPVHPIRLQQTVERVRQKIMLVREIDGLSPIPCPESSQI
ncbi:LytR/AlgR family response regulator transcription factor [Paenibacillus sepulcri]